MQEQLFAVLRIVGLPAQLRAWVESVLYAVVKSAPVMALPGTDEMDVAACTRWRKSPERPGCVECREVINGTANELRTLREELEFLTQRDVQCSVELVVAAA